MIIQSTNVRQCIEKLITYKMFSIHRAYTNWECTTTVLHLIHRHPNMNDMTCKVIFPKYILHIKSQINLVPCFGADWAVRAVLKILANFARCFFQNKCICKINTKFELSVHCRVRTKTLIIIKVRKKGQLLLENVLFWVKIQYNIWGRVYSQYL